jgi:GxGYxYP putative glycoside hydrolase C-terminal domain/GxGYxYP_N second domain/GxGYxYP third domain/GxGYxYP_N 1st domain
MKCKLLLCLTLVLLQTPAFAASGLFPKMPPATNVYVVNINKDSENAWMTDRALQGLINQKSAEVYLINNPWDRDVLNDCGKPYQKLPRLTGADGGLRSLFQKYQQRVKKMFIYDRDKDWTWYLALMSGAQQDGIPVTEAVKDELISEFSWKGDVEDFRNRWSNRIEAYNWALENLMPGCTKQVVFATGDPRDRGAFESPITDYAVASKGFVFWLDFKKPDEVAEIKKIFSTSGYGVGTSLMGYANVGDAANVVANPYGIGYVVSELYANGSFWSSFPDKTYKQSPGKAVKAEPGKIYACISWSDGDNLEVDQNPLYKYWHDPARGTIPVATPLAPALQELDTPLLDWYYSKMTTNDEIEADPSGFQFIYVELFNNSLFPAWCNLNRIWCADAGIRVANIWMARNPSSKYSTYLKTCGFEGVIADKWSIEAGMPPVLGDHGAGNEEQLYEQFAAIKPHENRPTFVSFCCIAGGFYHDGDLAYTAVKRQIDRINKEYPGRYVFLLPKDEFATIRAYYSFTNVPQQVTARPDDFNGLNPMKNDDGDFTIVERNGQHYWLVPKHNSPNYFYFDVRDDFLPKAGTAVEIDLGYLDKGSGEIALDYDSTEIRLSNTDLRSPDPGAWKRYPYVVHRMNSGQWKLARFFVNDARFANNENGGTDFRFYSGGDDLLISFVQVRRVNL